MTVVLMSIKPKWCEKILSGEKTLEIRKNKPKIKTPFKCYIYCTQGSGKNTLNIPISKEKLLNDYIEKDSMKSLNCPIGNGKVIGEFICDKIFEFEVLKSGAILNRHYIGFNKACLTMNEAAEYIGKGKKGYAWQISDLKIYDKPKELYEYCNMDICPYGAMVSCKGCKYAMKRAPQSWCYVNDCVAVDF